MALLNFQKLMEKLKTEELPPLIWIFGEETYFIDQCTNLIKERALGTGISDFNFDLFYAGQSKVVDVLQAVETLPMMSAWRLVFLKEAHLLKDKDLEALMPLFEKPVLSTCFVLLSPKIDRRKKCVKLVETHGQIAEMKSPFENQMDQWVHYIAKQRGLELTPEASFLLLEYLGCQLSEIDREMEKMATYVGSPPRRVEASDVHQVVPRSKAESVFDLADAVASCQLESAMTRLSRLLDQGQSEIGVLALMVRHLRILMNLREGMAEGLGSAGLAARAGVPPFFLKKYLEQAKRWSFEKLESAYRLALQTDRELKSSSVRSSFWMENFILKTQIRVKTST